MKAIVVLLILPLALAHPEWRDSGWGGSGWESSGWRDSGKKQEGEGGFDMQEAMKMLQNMMAEKHDDGGKSDDDSQEKGEGMMGMNHAELMQWVMYFRMQQGEKEGEREREDSGEEKDKRDMMKQFMEWKQKMEKAAREKREQEERERKAMEAMYQKQMMVQKLGKLAEEFHEQKVKLVHGVTFQFLEFCKCQDTSAMMKRFFAHNFGDPDFGKEWSVAMQSFGDKWGDWDMDDMRDDMQDRNGSANGNSTFFGNGTMGNGTRDNGDDHHMDAETYAKWTRAAMKFSKMTHKEQAGELFKGLVKGLCQRAGEYVAHVQQFEKFYIRWRLQMRDHH